MEFLEKDLEEIIYLSDKDKLEKRGLHLHGKLYRQFKIGNYGIADLIEVRRPFFHTGYRVKIKGTINILELKKEKIGVSTFFQALNYLKGIHGYLEKRGKEDYFNYQITLIGKTVDLSSSFCYLGRLFDIDINEDETYNNKKIKIELYKYSYGIEGLEFDEILDYDLKDKGF